MEKEIEWVIIRSTHDLTEYFTTSGVSLLDLFGDLLDVIIDNDMTSEYNVDKIVIGDGMIKIEGIGVSDRIYIMNSLSAFSVPKGSLDI
jgi:hypothetical protein